MKSHDIRISVEHYEDGGFGVISYNFQEMGLTTMSEVHYALTKIMNKEIDKLLEVAGDVPE